MDTADGSKQAKAHVQQGKRDNSSATQAQGEDGAERAAETGRGLRKKGAAMPPSLEAIMKDVVPEAGNAPSGTMARLERRVYVLERAFADIVERHEKSIRERSSSVAVVEESFGAVGRRVDDVRKEHEGNLASLREAFDAALMRLNALEEQAAKTEASAAAAPEQTAPSAGDAPPDVPAAQDMAPASAAPPVTADAESEANAEPVMSSEPPPIENETYLTAARRAAMAAQNEQHQMQAMVRDSAPRRMSRVRLLLLGSAAPAVVVLAGILALNRHTVTARPVAPPPAKLAVTVARISSPPPQVVGEQPSDPTPAQTASAGPIDALVARAAGGDSQAQRDLGLKYLAGDGVEADEAAAAGWLMRSAYAGDANAEYWLGTLYARGHGVPADAFQANHWYEAAAQQGNPRAMHSLAVANFEGWGKTKDEAEAARWFEKAATLGLVDSQFDLAVLYERGAGVTASKSEAYKWYAIAAKSGDTESQARLAVLAKELNPAELAQAQQQAAAFKSSAADEAADAAKDAKSGG